MNIREIKAMFEHERDGFVPGIEFHRGTVIGVLNKACHGDANRKLVMKYLTGKTSSSLLTDAEFYAFYKLALPFKPEGGKWTTQRGEAELASICGTILAASLDQEGQLKMFSETPPIAESSEAWKMFVEKS